MNAGRLDIGGNLVSRPAIGGQHDFSSRRHAIPIDKNPHALGEHDAGTIIVGKGKRPFMRSSSEHDPFRAHLPQSFTGKPVGRLCEMISDSFRQRYMIVIAIAERGCARQRDHVFARFQRSDGLFEPRPGRDTVDLGNGVVQKSATQFWLFVGKNDALAVSGGGKRGCDASRASADDKDVAVSVAMDITVGIRFAWRNAKTGCSADSRLIDLVPERPRPHECLVVEARNQNRREQVVHRSEIVLQ